MIHPEKFPTWIAESESDSDMYQCTSKTHVKHAIHTT